MNDFEITDNPSPDDVTKLSAGLRAYAAENDVEPRIVVPLGIFKRDQNKEIIAGLEGYTVWNWLCINRLWVHESLRRQKIGAALIQAAEEIAVRRG